MGWGLGVRGLNCSLWQRPHKVPLCQLIKHQASLLLTHTLEAAAETGWFLTEYLSCQFFINCPSLTADNLQPNGTNPLLQEKNALGKVHIWLCYLSAFCCSSFRNSSVPVQCQPIQSLQTHEPQHSRSPASTHVH